MSFDHDCYYDGGNIGREVESYSYDSCGGGGAEYEYAGSDHGEADDAAKRSNYQPHARSGYAFAAAFPLLRLELPDFDIRVVGAFTRYPGSSESSRVAMYSEQSRAESDSTDAELRASTTRQTDILLDGVYLKT
jgi:hypothetical protein